MNNWITALLILVFIGGSVIVNPDANSFVIKLLNIKPSNAVKLIPSEMEEYGLRTLLKSCAGVEGLGESQGISSPKEKTCREACGKRNMDYYSYDCEKDLLVCYCL